MGPGPIIWTSPVREMMAEKEREIERLKDERHGLQKRVKELERERYDLIEQLNKKDTKLLELESERDQLRKFIAEIERERIKKRVSLEERIIALKQRVRELERELAGAKEEEKI